MSGFVSQDLDLKQVSYGRLTEGCPDLDNQV